MGKKKDDLSAVGWDTLFDQVEIWRWVGGAARKHKTTGKLLDRQYFQVYKLEEEYELRADNRIRASDEPDDAGVPTAAARSVQPDALGSTLIPTASPPSEIEPQGEPQGPEHELTA
jgi:hypothetical protein